MCAPNNIVLIVITTPPTHMRTKTRTKVLDISLESFDLDRKKLSNKVQNKGPHKSHCFKLEFLAGKHRGRIEYDVLL